ncbi:MAG: hypothetical protein L3J71_04790 [Victivallaceae bacterium]|nr:hypothetical protein [Victivallaceae bacterium]
MYIKINKTAIPLQALCCLWFVLGMSGCSTGKKMPDTLPNVKYSTPGAGQHPGQPLPKRASGTGDGSGKGQNGTGSGEGGGDSKGTGKGKGTGDVPDAKGQGQAENKGKGSSSSGKSQDEVAGFLNLGKIESPQLREGVNKLLSREKSTPASMPLTGKRLPDTKKVRMPSQNTGRKLISALEKSSAETDSPKPPPQIILVAPRRNAPQFSAAPPVLKKVDNSFMPYKIGDVITLDTNLVPVSKDSSRIICLYSGASVYLSFKHDDVKMNGLYVRGKFKVRGIVKDKFSGKYVPVAVLEKL